ncbi:hypothetical protein [Natronoflexus pectinivorans]|uniref:Uncharacterized protein n=1 Tax=Natronoflexus pectinivorans TaxID=682526 RepID=A0A4R2GFL5_9BACT|nr:hypothetical protein [Natronoflexus pectinivorans]TCO06800.1 hypothetical protein EV194_11221 [Natronoflexus pectinivorans]
MKRLVQIFVVLAILVAGWSCERDYLFRGGSDGVKLSADTIMFDTIFTTIGSTTRQFRIYNPYSADMTIDDIRLAGGDDSKFRINVSGLPGPHISDVPIRSGDSIFVFVEVTIDPAGTDAPFVVMDSIIIFTRERMQSVKLIAYGQDVVLMKGQVLNTQTFTSNKPYLIYDYIHVDTTATLTIESGTRLHFYKNANLIVSGSLKVQGTKEEPVLFTGSRLEEWYADKPGQWGTIWLMPGSRNHEINYAIIKNGTRGLVVDSVGMNGSEPVYISNSRIEHKMLQGLLAQSSSLVVSNSLFADCGSASVALTVGGNYEFYFSTIANYYQWAFRNRPALIVSNYYPDGATGAKVPHALENALFSNCIIYGQLENEIELDFYEGEAGDPEDPDYVPPVINYQFEHSLIRMRSMPTTFNDPYNDYPHYRNVLINRDPFFKAPRDYDYRLDSLSVAIGAGDVTVARQFPVDINGNNREKKPDIGFMQRVNSE